MFGEFFTKVVTFLSKPLPIGQVYVREIFVEHFIEILPVYLQKNSNKIPLSISK